MMNVMLTIVNYILRLMLLFIQGWVIKSADESASGCCEKVPQKYCEIELANKTVVIVDVSENMSRCIHSY